MHLKINVIQQCQCYAVFKIDFDSITRQRKIREIIPHRDKQHENSADSIRHLNRVFSYRSKYWMLPKFFNNSAWGIFFKYKFGKRKYSNYCLTTKEIQTLFQFNM